MLQEVGSSVGEPPSFQASSPCPPWNGHSHTSLHSFTTAGATSNLLPEPGGASALLSAGDPLFPHNGDKSPGTALCTSLIITVVKPGASGFRTGAQFQNLLQPELAAN